MINLPPFQGFSQTTDPEATVWLAPAPHPHPPPPSPPAPTFTPLLALCEWNSLVTGEFPSQSPVTQSFDALFHLRLNKQLSRPSRSGWLETPSHSLWRHSFVLRNTPSAAINRDMDTQSYNQITEMWSWGGSQFYLCVPEHQMRSLEDWKPQNQGFIFSFSYGRARVTLASRMG